MEFYKDCLNIKSVYSFNICLYKEGYRSGG